MVVEPQGGCAVVVRVLARLRPGLGRDAEALLGQPGQVGVPPPGGGELGIEVGRGGQVPRLRVAVALVADPLRAVQVGDDRHRAPVRRVLRRRVGVLAGRHEDAAGEVRLLVGRPMAVPVRQPLGVRPVQARVDREEVRQRSAVDVDEVVDPPDPHRDPDGGLDGQRRRVVQCGSGTRRTVAPHGRQGQWRRQHGLLELPHGDLVVVGAPRPPPRDGARSRHHRRDEQRRGELRHGARVEAATRQARERDALTRGGRREERERRRPGVLQERPSTEHRPASPTRSPELLRPP